MKMLLTTEEIKKYLSILKIEDENSMDLRQVKTSYLKLALVTHPDKTGKDSNAAFQELKEAYENIRDHIREKSNIDEEAKAESDDIERFFDDNFEKFNVPQENNGSFTVFIENSLAQAWQDCITSILGEPKVKINSNGVECDRSWKVSYTQQKTIDITIHIYKNPRNKTGSKLMLQGSIQTMICSYVFTELPKIYKMVCETRPKFLDDKAKVKQKALVKCEQCRFKSSMIQMKMHIKNIHTKKPVRASKRLQAFTPKIKSAKRSKPESVSEDTSFLMVPDITEGVEVITLEEDKKGEAQELSNAVNMDVVDILSCSKCDFETERENDLQRHVDSGIHHISDSASYKCEECAFSFKTEALLKDHEMKSHKNSCIQQTCGFCAFKTYNLGDLKEHEVQEHGLIHCDKCDYSALDKDILKQHITKHTGRIIFQCGKCEFEATRQSLLVDHKETKHPEIQSPEIDTKRRCEKCEKDFEGGFIFEAHKCIISSKYQCEQCDFTAVSLVELLEHMVEVHTQTMKDHLAHIKQSSPEVSSIPVPETSGIKCDQCDVQAENVSAMINHIRAKHCNFIPCNFCDFEAHNHGDLKSHMYEKHPEVVMIHTMSDQMNIISETFGRFENMFKIILDNQNIMKQELFIVKNKQLEQDKNIDIHEGKNKRVASNSNPTFPSQNSAPEIPAKMTYSEVTSSYPKTSSPKFQSSPNISQPEPAQQKKTENILFIGDSISSNVHIKHLEHATEANIVTAKAYSAVYDNESNVAKQAPKFPEVNFTDVVRRELDYGDFKTLLLQAGSIDVTNLNTSENPEEYMDYFRQITVMSANNIFQAATNAVRSKPYLRKVIIMKQIPRYDPLDVDPLGLKPSLSLLFNNTLSNLWLESPMKDKLFVGDHNIECSGAIREARYRHTKTGRFDGIHLYGSSGRKAYTNSVLDILRRANVTSPDFHGPCEQFRYQTRQTRTNNIQAGRVRQRQPVRQSVFTVPTYNRFETLYSQGNW